jgi:nitroreductase
MDLREALRTTGAVRTFTDEPVSDDVVRDLLDDARFAPSGGNRQGWRVAVVKDPGIRTELGTLMSGVWDEYRAQLATGVTAFTTVPPSGWVRPRPPFAHEPNPLVDHLADVPVVLVIAADLSLLSTMDAELPRVGVVGGASIYPFCGNLLLAARARGLGGVLTTFLARAEPAAAPVLGLPDGWAICGTVFLGHPVHQPTKLRRADVRTFTTVDRFDGPAFG